MRAPVSSVKSALILLPFLTIALHESGILCNMYQKSYIYIGQWP